MNVPENYMRVVGRRCYRVKTATLLASDYCRDSSNGERNSRNTFVYCTFKGDYFKVNLTLCQGERNTLTPLSVESAVDLYEALPEKEVTFEEAFPDVFLV